MNIIFLRGSVPPLNEHPEKLIYKQIDSCEDVWTQLFYALTKKFNARGTLLYQGGNRKHTVDASFDDVWVPAIGKHSPFRAPDLIVCRGGFPYYDEFVQKYPKAKKVYYGAGKRFYPTGRFSDYDLFLVDSIQQLNDITKLKKNSRLFIKPAAKMFRPVDVPKIYDICFVANGTQHKIKRHALLFKSIVGTQYSVLNIGNIDQSIRRLARDLGVNVTFDGWDCRKNLSGKISSCKVGVCCSTNYDSCPRVIPEYLACGLPIVATSNMNFWHDKYVVNDVSGCLVEENDILNGIRSATKLPGSRKFYDENVSMDIAADYLYNLCKTIL